MANGLSRVYHAGCLTGSIIITVIILWSCLKTVNVLACLAYKIPIS